jgi:IMP dehydrogenase
MLQAVSFDDVLLVPKRTFGGSRKQVDLTTYICGRRMKVPIFSANMSSVTEAQMAVAMRRNDGLGVLHRMCSLKEQHQMVQDVYLGVSECTVHDTPAYVSIEGTAVKALERIHSVQHLQPYGYCVDVAHADSSDVEDTLVEIRKEFPNIPIMVGNYATPEGIENLLSCNVGDALNLSFKIGIGSGSQCTTRIVTGCGLPTLESIFRIRNRVPKTVGLIADGGFKNSGDIVKALAAGANAVMLGSLLAGTKEAPGNVIKNSGGLYKVYRGSASFGQKFESGKKGYIEGEETLVPYKGHLTTILNSLVEGIKSGFSYCGALNMEEIQDNAEFVQITQHGFKESTDHGNS